MAAPLLRPGLLEGLTVAVAGVGAPGELGEAAGEAAASLGAQVTRIAVDPFGEEPAASGPADRLVWDGAAAFGAHPGPDGVRAALDGAWLALRAVAVAGWIEAERPGRVVLLAPRPGDAHAEAARAGLETLARALSIEWSRFGVLVVAIHPGRTTQARAVAELCGFLASAAGAYHQGSVIALR
jgi:hypothetical protein